MSRSPFPGMDPYLEDPALWPEFHGRLVTALNRLLFSGLPVLRYESAVGRRLYAAGTAEHREDYLEIREKGDRRLVTLLDVVSPANKTTDAGRQAYLEQRRAARVTDDVQIPDKLVHGRFGVGVTAEGYLAHALEQAGEGRVVG